MREGEHGHGRGQEDEPEEVGELAGVREVDEVAEEGAAEEGDGGFAHEEDADPVFSCCISVYGVQDSLKCKSCVRSSYGTPARSLSAVGITGTIYFLTLACDRNYTRYR